MLFSCVGHRPWVLLDKWRTRLNVSGVGVVVGGCKCLGIMTDLCVCVRVCDLIQKWMADDVFGMLIGSGRKRVTAHRLICARDAMMIGHNGFCYVICDTCIIVGWLGLECAYFPFPERHDRQIRAVRRLLLALIGYHRYHCMMRTVAAAAAAGAHNRHRSVDVGCRRCWHRLARTLRSYRRFQTNGWPDSSCLHRCDTASVWNPGIGATANSIGHSMPTADRRMFASVVNRSQIEPEQWWLLPAPNTAENKKRTVSIR